MIKMKIMGTQAKALLLCTYSVWSMRSSVSIEIRFETVQVETVFE